MANDGDNVTEHPSTSKKTRKADAILSQIKGEWKDQKAKEFKNSAQVLMREIDSLEKTLALKKSELIKMVAEFDADNN